MWAFGCVHLDVDMWAFRRGHVGVWTWTCGRLDVSTWATHMGVCDDCSTSFCRGVEELDFHKKRNEKSEEQKVLKVDEVRKVFKTFPQTSSQDVGGRRGWVMLAVLSKGACDEKVTATTEIFCFPTSSARRR
jgi:hypothetical protein